MMRPTWSKNLHERARLSVVAAAIAALLLGCSTTTSAPDGAPDSTAPDADRKLSSRASSALTTCREQLDGIDARGPDERVEFAVEACSGIWLEGACAKAFDEALDLESYQRAGLIFRSCRDAYCPRLAGGLALCEASLTDPVSLIEPLDDPARTDPLAAWSQFNSAIFVRDYEADPDEQILSGFPSMLLQLVIVAPPRDRAIGETDE